MTWHQFAPSDIDGIDAPAFAGTAVIARHAPTQSGGCGNQWQVDHGRDEALRIPAPCLTTSNRTAPVAGNRAVVAAHNEATAGRKNVSKRVSTVRADLQYAAVEADIGIGGGFKIKIVAECQLSAARFSKEDGRRIEPFVAYYSGVINECSIGRCIRRWAGHAAI
jgi:hypothetical protein